MMSKLAEELLKSNGMMLGHPDDILEATRRLVVEESLESLAIVYRGARSDDVRSCIACVIGERQKADEFWFSEVMMRHAPIKARYNIISCVMSQIDAMGRANVGSEPLVTFICACLSGVGDRLVSGGAFELLEVLFENAWHVNDAERGRLLAAVEQAEVAVRQAWAKELTFVMERLTSG